MAFPEGWQRKCAIVIQAAQVAETLTDFPLLVTGDNFPAEIWANADDGGGDLRFSADDAGAVRLACEIVRFDTSGETAEIYVKVPSVSIAVNTTIYVWYNNTGQTQPAASDTYGSQNVWGSDYAAVYHFAQNPAGGTLLDSTANANNGTPQGGMDAADLIFDNNLSGWDFDGTNDYVMTNNNITNYLSDKLSVFIIVKPTILPPSPRFSNKGVLGAWNSIHSFVIWTNLGNDLDYELSVVTSSGRSDAQAPSENNQNPHYVHGVFDSAAKIFINSVLKATGATRAGDINNSTQKLIIGSYEPSISFCFPGIIYELRLKATVVTPEYLASEYNNINTPATFSIAGTPAAVQTFNPAWARHANKIIRAI